jgi:hypothetical protein
MEEAERLERLSEIADAKLGVAEDLRWIIAVLVAALVYERTDHSFIYAAVAFVAAFALTVYEFREAATKAEDAWLRATSLGKYAPRAETTDEV